MASRVGCTVSDVPCGDYLYRADTPVDSPRSVDPDEGSLLVGSAFRRVFSRSRYGDSDLAEAGSVSFDGLPPVAYDSSSVSSSADSSSVSSGTRSFRSVDPDARTKVAFVKETVEIVFERWDEYEKTADPSYFITKREVKANRAMVGSDNIQKKISEAIDGSRRTALLCSLLSLYHSCEDFAQKEVYKRLLMDNLHYLDPSLREQVKFALWVRDGMRDTRGADTGEEILQTSILVDPEIGDEIEKAHAEFRVYKMDFETLKEFKDRILQLSSQNLFNNRYDSIDDSYPWRWKLTLLMQLIDIWRYDPKDKSLSKEEYEEACHILYASLLDMPLALEDFDCFRKLVEFSFTWLRENLLTPSGIHILRMIHHMVFFSLDTQDRYNQCLRFIVSYWDPQTTEVRKEAIMQYLPRALKRGEVDPSLLEEVKYALWWWFTGQKDTKGADTGWEILMAEFASNRFVAETLVRCSKKARVSCNQFESLKSFMAKLVLTIKTGSMERGSHNRHAWGWKYFIFMQLIDIKKYQPEDDTSDAMYKKTCLDVFNHLLKEHPEMVSFLQEIVDLNWLKDNLIAPAGIHVLREVHLKITDWATPVEYLT